MSGYRRSPRLGPECIIARPPDAFYILARRGHADIRVTDICAKAACTPHLMRNCHQTRYSSQSLYPLTVHPPCEKHSPHMSPTTFTNIDPPRPQHLGTKASCCLLGLPPCGSSPQHPSGSSAFSTISKLWSVYVYTGPPSSSRIWWVNSPMYVQQYTI